MEVDINVQYCHEPLCLVKYTCFRRICLSVNQLEGQLAKLSEHVSAMRSVLVKGNLVHVIFTLYLCPPNSKWAPWLS